MAGPNGTGSPGVLHLEDIAFETATITTTINGQPFAAEGRVNGPGCPGDTKAEFARVYHRYGQAEGASEAVTIDFLTDALKIVLGIDYQHANILAGDIDRGLSILRHLRWLRAADAPDEDDADPEASGGEASLTTPSSSPISQQPTAAPAPTAAAG